MLLTQNTNMKKIDNIEDAFLLSREEAEQFLTAGDCYARINHRICLVVLSKLKKVPNTEYWYLCSLDGVYRLLIHSKDKPHVDRLITEIDDLSPKQVTLVDPE